MKKARPLSPQAGFKQRWPKARNEKAGGRRFTYNAQGERRGTEGPAHCITGRGKKERTFKSSAGGGGQRSDPPPPHQPQPLLSSKKKLFQTQEHPTSDVAENKVKKPKHKEKSQI